MTSAVHPHTRRRLAALFCIPFAFSLIFFSVSLATEQASTDLKQTQDLISDVLRLRSLANDVESGERGFLLTSDRTYLHPLTSATRQISGLSEDVRRYAQLQPESIQQLLNRFLGFVTARVAQASKVVEAANENGVAAAIELVKVDESEITMNQIRLAAGNLYKPLNDEATEYVSRQHSLHLWAFVSFGLGSLIMLGVMFWLYNALLSYIAGRDQAHAELHALNAQLEAKVEERTRDLTEVNQELQQFAYVASHDLQEPLRTVTSFTQLLATRYRGRLDADADEFIDYIVAGSRRMTDLINGLLQVVRLRKAGPVAQVAFTELLKEAETALQASIRETGAEIIAEPLPSLVIDRVQFSQVFQNLISNAIKYRREVRPVITVRAAREETNWVISVSDNARGFDQRFAERIFGIFQRLHGREVEGTGMGLAIVKRIIERHGGRIWAQSEEGVGSTFCFSLPITLEVSRHAEAPAPKAVAQV